MSELKNCPFCGLESKITEYSRDNSTGRSFGVNCIDECNGDYYYTKAEAIKQYNKRTADAEINQLRKSKRSARGAFIFPAGLTSATATDATATDATAHGYASRPLRPRSWFAAMVLGAMLWGFVAGVLWWYV